MKRELCSRRFLMLCVIGSFCFSYIRQLNDRPNGICSPAKCCHDMSAPRRTKRRGETPGQERHSGRAAKAFLTLSLLRAHFYTGVFHTSYVRSARQTDNNYEVVSVPASLCSEQGAAPLALLCSYPSALVSTKRFFKSFRPHKAENTNTQRRFYGIHT